MVSKNEGKVAPSRVDGLMEMFCSASTCLGKQLEVNITQGLGCLGNTAEGQCSEFLMIQDVCEIAIAVAVI